MSKPLNTLTSEELFRALKAEMMRLHDSGAGMRIEVSPAHAFAVVAHVQLALRHPDVPANASAALAREFVEYVRAKFEPHAPAIAEAIRRGDDPEYDTPREPQQFEPRQSWETFEEARKRNGMEPAKPRDPQPGTIPPETRPAPTRRAVDTKTNIEEIPRDRRAAMEPPPLTCPFCGFANALPFAKIDIYICAGCNRTVEVKPQS